MRERLRHNRGRIRGFGADYLAYTIIDAIVDHYFPVLESFADRIDELEEDVLTARANVLAMLQDIERELLLLRRAVWPLREMIGTLARDECEVLVSEQDPALSAGLSGSRGAVDGRARELPRALDRR